jgi:hypothetical protein
VTQAKYLADLLVLQVPNTNVAHHINDGDYDALADYFVDDAKYEEDMQTSKGRDAIVAWFRDRSDAAQAPTRHIYSAVHVVIVDPRFARGSSLRVSYVARRSPHDPALASPIVYDVYRLGVNQRRAAAACDTTRPVPLPPGRLPHGNEMA